MIKHSFLDRDRESAKKIPWWINDLLDEKQTATLIGQFRINIQRFKDKCTNHETKKILSDLEATIQARAQCWKKEFDGVINEYENKVGDLPNDDLKQFEIQCLAYRNYIEALVRNFKYFCFGENFLLEVYLKNTLEQIAEQLNDKVYIAFSDSEFEKARREVAPNMQGKTLAHYEKQKSLIRARYERKEKQDNSLPELYKNVPCICIV